MTSHKISPATTTNGPSNMMNQITASPNTRMILPRTPVALWKVSPGCQAIGVGVVVGVGVRVGVVVGVAVVVGVMVGVGILGER